ncbi:hypothetical protein BDC45DRAFT_541230 [Circinella umbellata]|nr:hypothetical protein BDC45DRAFT_541230 [Circinella umbellata]
MDMLFFCDDCEPGCTKVGKDIVDVNDDKYMGDGMLKLPKAMKDLCYVWLQYFIQGLNLKVVMLDSPGVEYFSKKTVHTDAISIQKKDQRYHTHHRIYMGKQNL